jgi:hypothetical protein
MVRGENVVDWVVGCGCGLRVISNSAMMLGIDENMTV